MLQNLALSDLRSVSYKRVKIFCFVPGYLRSQKVKLQFKLILPNYSVRRSRYSVTQVLIFFTVNLLIFFSLSGFEFSRCYAEDSAGLPQRVLTLDEAIQMALVNNRSLGRAKLGIESSRISYQGQQEEFLFKIHPNVQTGYSSASEQAWRAGAGFSRRFTSGINLSVNPFVGGQDDEFQTGIAARLELPLLRGLGKEFALNNVYSSRYSYQDARISYHLKQVDTVLQTVQTVYSILLSEQQIDLLEKQLRNLRGHLALAKIKEKAGIISVIDLYRAEIRIKNVEREFSIRQESRDRALDELKRLLGMTQDSNVAITAPIRYQPVELEEEEAVNIALANRPEIEQSKRLVAETKRQLLLAEKNLQPQLNLELGYDKTGDDLDFGFEEDIWTVRLKSDTDLFGRGKKKAYAQQKISYRQVLNDRMSQKERIIQEVRAQLNTMAQQLQRIALRDKELHQTKGKLRLAESKFRNGLADNFELIEAQTEMQNAENAKLTEQIKYLLETYQLRSTLGTLLEYQEADSEVMP